jgi:hypothetical protein
MMLTEVTRIAALAMIGFSTSPSANEYPGRDRRRERVDGEGGEQILPDVAHRSPIGPAWLGLSRRGERHRE